MKVIIIEDEPKTAEDIELMLKQIDASLEVNAKLDSVESSVEYFLNNSAPDLAFMDIQLADGLSFEIFKEVRIVCPVIFLTAFDKYAIEAFKANGIDYILKPFDRKTLELALKKYQDLSEHFSEKTSVNKGIEEILKNYKGTGKSTYLISSGGKYFPLSVKDVALFYIESGAAFAQTFTGKTHSINYTLDEIEASSDAKQFYRANRQILLNFSAIREVEHYVNRKLAVKLTVQFKEAVIVSKNKAVHFLNWIESH